MNGFAEQIDSDQRTVIYIGENQVRESIQYDRLILATGSRLAAPNVPGLGQYNFSNDKLPEAQRLQRHLLVLGERPDTPARNTVVVAGGGFTGIETAAELPSYQRDRAENEVRRVHPNRVLRVRHRVSHPETRRTRHRRQPHTAPTHSKLGPSRSIASAR